MRFIEPAGAMVLDSRLKGRLGDHGSGEAFMILPPEFHKNKEGRKAGKDFRNNAGDIAGESATGALNTAHGILYSGGKMIDLGTLATTPDREGLATSLNNFDQVVGWSITDNGHQHAFVVDHGAMTDLNSLVDPSLGWELYYANGINDAGQIVGIGAVPSGTVDSFLLTPNSASVPEPSGASCLSVAAAMALLGRRRSWMLCTRRG
jgi:probable HAF family extracellular repeat protein